jgi:tetratricopeptide (TPR) repeat protein
MERALQEGMAAVALAPANVPQRNNVGLYAMYAGEFDRAIKEQNAVLALNPRFNLAYVGKALSQLASGDNAGAVTTWQQLARLNAHGASSAAAGLADLALFQGRLQDAVTILRPGAEDDIKGGSPDDAAIKFAKLAYAEAYRHNRAEAIAAADRALALSHDDNIRVMTAEVYASVGMPAKAQANATALAAKLGTDARAYSRLISGMILLQSGKRVPAIDEMRDAQKIADTWLGHFYLGRAYIAANAFAEADSEFDACLRRRGEATAVFLDENPTYHLFPLVYYYDGIAREGLNSPSAKESFQNFVVLRARQQGDPLVADAVRHH